MTRNGEAKTIVPVPDPTDQTRQSISHEIDNVKELFNQRVTAMDKAMSLFNENITRVPTDVDKQVAKLQELIEAKLEIIGEKFNSVQTQFRERDVRVEQTARDTKVAVDAALMAAENARQATNEASSLSIAKSETSTNKQIDQLGELIKTNMSATSDKFDDLKERLLRLEGEQLGGRTMEANQQASRASMVGVIGLVVGAVIGIGGLIISVVLHWPGAK